MAGEPSSTHDVFLLDLSESGTATWNSGLLLKALHEKEIHPFTIEDVGEPLTPGGDKIPQALVTAIKAFKIAIVVVPGGTSHDVSLRRWKVLIHILDYFQGKPQHIIPVYYVPRSAAHDEPSGVDEEPSFEGRKKKFRVETGNDEYRVSKALAKLDSLPGWDFNWHEKNKDEFNREIASQVSKMLNRAPLHVAAYPVGLESRLKEVWSFLKLTSCNREFLSIGFYGMQQGIGKSTLARAVYNSVAHLFEVSCFLDNIRENSNKQGLVGVQKMLLSQISEETDIQLENVGEGVSMIKDRLHQKDVLLFLDDVDSLDQLEALGRGPGWGFSSGSRVIITTRDEHLLTYHGNEYEVLPYEVQALNDQDALELLSHKAFAHGNVDPNYTDVLNRAIRYASGLPLVLDMIGSYMCGKSVDECEKALVQLERIPYNDIQSIQGALTTSRSDPEASHISLRDTEETPLNVTESSQTESNATSRSDPEASHISLRVTEETPLNVTESSQTESNAGVTSQMDFQKWTLILVFLVSCGVGLSCNAQSSVNDEDKNRWWWPVFKKFPYVVVVSAAVLVVLATVLRLNRYEIIRRLNRHEIIRRLNRHAIIRRLKWCIHYVIFLGITVYAEYYNRVVEPGIWSAFSNGAFALTSVSLSKLLRVSEVGMFSYFLGCFMIHLMTVKWYLIFVAIFIGALLFDWHSSSEPFLLTRIIRWFRAIPPRNLHD